ncbi:ester cyclase [Roseomonas terrae]|jgi:hypothetical protein|uniref:Ester cyclase n=1 Tax=Neoroseomonas terrae TaxID=424799 RepID=A0ABS5EAS0_9PROT|nr:ester cyclase [Neoroseomonas terrae]MBR0648115.1 ester cyclase [Neoroseomonas terrae]
MGGCGALDDPCGEEPEGDSSGEVREDWLILVRNFIDSVWNHEWSEEENLKFNQQVGAGDRFYVPAGIKTALAEFCTPTVVRHRRDASGKAIRADGPDDYPNCVNRVHEVVQDLRLLVDDLTVCDEDVIALITMTGRDRRADGRLDMPGAFGKPTPTELRFTVPITTAYRIVDGRIAEDWLITRGTPTYTR